EVVMTRELTEVSGAAADARGRPVADAVVVAVAADAERRYRGSRFVGHADTARDGTFAIRPLAPGDYLVARLDKRTILDVDTELDDADFLESLAAGAARLTLEEGQRATVALRAR